MHYGGNSNAQFYRFLLKVLAQIKYNAGKTVIIWFVIKMVKNCTCLSKL